MKQTLSFILLLLSFSPVLYAQHIEVLQQGKATSIRGLSVVDDNTAWISGSKGTISITTDGGKTWNWQTVKGYEKADFRDIEAFSDKEAVIMSSGTPALILKTTDGGATWQEKYRKTDTAYFLDAMDFADKLHGYILGDPINNKFLLLETKDGGETWQPFKYPPTALPGEAAFAASGTCLRFSCDLLYIITGGTASRLLTWHGTKSWDYKDIPLSHGKSSQGGFSFACGDNLGVLVGGDYSNDKKIDSVAAIQITRNRFISPVKSPVGFQSCVEHVSPQTFLSTGTPGSNLTTDDGKTWTKIDDASYNVCRKARSGKLVLLAGNGGKIGIFKP